MGGVGGEEGNTHGNDIDVGGILVVGQTKTRFQVCAFYILKYSRIHDPGTTLCDLRLPSLVSHSEGRICSAWINDFQPLRLFLQ